MDGMPINDKNTPVTLPNNQLTQMIELIAARNAGQAVMPPSMMGVPIAGTPLPTARSADLGRPVMVPDVPMPPTDRPLSAEEIEELNRAAVASGLVQGPVNPGIANTLGTQDDDMGGYASLEDAIRAGASVGMSEDETEDAAVRHRDPMPSTPVVRVRTPVGGQRVTPGSVRPVRTAEEPALPKLPNFKKVQMIDLVNGKVYVDGLAFDTTPDELKMLRKFAVKKVKEQIQAMLDAALAEDVDGEPETL